MHQKVDWASSPSRLATTPCQAPPLACSAGIGASVHGHCLIRCWGGFCALPRSGQLATMEAPPPALYRGKWSDRRREIPQFAGTTELPIRLSTAQWTDSWNVQGEMPGPAHPPYSGGTPGTGRKSDCCDPGSSATATGSSFVNKGLCDVHIPGDTAS